MGLILVQLGFYPHLAVDGYQQYRKLVKQMMEKEVGKFRMIVITGPKHGGKGQLVQIIRENGEQLLDLELLSVLHSPSQECFETLLFNRLLQFTADKVVWVVYQSGELGGMMLSQRIKEMMCMSGRVHMETKLEERIKFIIQDFQCICKDQNDANAAMIDIENVAEKSKEETWEDVVNRSDDGEDWARDLMDVHRMLSIIVSGEEENREGNIFFIGRPREGEDNTTPRFMDE